MTPDNQGCGRFIPSCIRRRIAGANPYTPEEVQTPQANTAIEAEVWRQAHEAFGSPSHAEPVYFKTPDERAAEADTSPGSASWVSTQARQIHNAAGEKELLITREDHAITCVSHRRTDGPDVVDFSYTITRLRLAMGEGRPSVLQSQAIRIDTTGEGQLTLAVDHQGQWVPQTFTPQARAHLQESIEVAVDHAVVDRVRELNEGPTRSNPVLSGEALPIPTRYLRDLEVDIHASWQDVGDDHGEPILARLATVLQYPLLEREKHRLPRDSVASTARRAQALYQHGSHDGHEPQPWPESKPELYALTAVLIEKMMPYVQRRYEQRKHTFSSRPSVTYYRANNRVQEMIQVMLTDAVDELLTDADVHTQSVITRVEALLDERHKRSVDPMPVDTYIIRGINTAASTIGNMFLIAPDVFESTYGRKPSADELKTMMANSYPLALELASLHLVGFVTTDKQIRVGRSTENDYNPRWFTIKPGVHRLEFHPDRWDELSAYMTKTQEGKNEPRVGCPSIFSVAPPNRSPLYHIYTYVTELHGQVYEWYFSTK